MAVEHIAGLSLEGLKHRPGLGGHLRRVDGGQPHRQRPQGDAEDPAGLVVAGDLDGDNRRAGPGLPPELGGLTIGVDAQRFAEGGEGHRAVALLVDGAGGGQDEPTPEGHAGEG